MKGIPTVYRGVRFRSRLEARWAVMFDLLAWRWNYEPFDLAGYIPDFVCGIGSCNVLLEVKPALARDELEAAVPKIRASGWNKPFAVVGTSLLAGGDPFDEQLARGWLGTEHYDWGTDSHGEALLELLEGRPVGLRSYKCAQCSREVLGIRGTWGFTCIACGSILGLHKSDWNERFAQAGNEVQWMPR